LHLTQFLHCYRSEMHALLENLDIIKASIYKCLLDV
jgi:hypothetical protein